MRATERREDGRRVEHAPVGHLDVLARQQDLARHLLIRQPVEHACSARGGERARNEDGRCP
eukprot:2219753-Prymnesium_polylepis.1